MVGLTRRCVSFAALGFVAAPAFAANDTPQVRVAAIGDGLSLHYVETGSGESVIFVHGSLSDGSYWNGQLPAFAAAGRHAIAYSRRYNSPNENPARPGYSAVVDADDLAGLIRSLGLGRVHLVGHSYGALTSLILAVRRPELVRTVVLAEPPAMSLLDYVPTPDTAKGKAMLADVKARMVAPMRQAFARGDREGGVRIFIDYVFGRPGAWDAMSAADHAETLKDAHEWDVMMTTGELFPVVTPKEVQAVRAPTLLMSGDKSYPFLGLIDEALMSLLPNANRLVLKGAGHQMWLQQPETCRAAALALQAKA